MSDKAEELGVWAVVVGLQQQVPGMTINSASLFWQRGCSKSEAIEGALAFAAEERPGFSVWETAATFIPDPPQRAV